MGQLEGKALQSSISPHVATASVELMMLMTSLMVLEMMQREPLKATESLLEKQPVHHLC